jgi:hypothetical protein
MIFTKRLRISCAVFMAAIMTNIPYLAWGEALTAARPVPKKMISTSVVVDDMARAKAEEKINSYLNRAEIRSELIKRGVSPEEVSSRLASLSDQELKQLAGQMDEAMYGGDVVGILIVVLLVLLIIYLAKRI